VFFEDSSNVNLTRSIYNFQIYLLIMKSISGNGENDLNIGGLDRGPIQKRPYQIQ
jgi:hypothetical protein